MGRPKDRFDASAEVGSKVEHSLSPVLFVRPPFATDNFLRVLSTVEQEGELIEFVLGLL